MFQIMLDLFRNSLRTKLEICLQTIADFVYRCVLSLTGIRAAATMLCKRELTGRGSV